jgi:hypothetical protein
MLHTVSLSLAGYKRKSRESVRTATQRQRPGRLTTVRLSRLFRDLLVALYGPKVENQLRGRSPKEIVGCQGVTAYAGRNVYDAEIPDVNCNLDDAAGGMTRRIE